MLNSGSQRSCFLGRHGYLRDQQEAATDLVIEQAELSGQEWAA